MTAIDPATIKWPSPWTPIADETAALSVGRARNKSVAKTILGELQREICRTHPLQGVKCVPLAYDSTKKTDFLFQTDRDDMPFVLVHFTWAVEQDPRVPFTTRYATLNDFLNEERKQQRKWWQFWK